jgi:hypothetical protein
MGACARSAWSEKMTKSEQAARVRAAIERYTKKNTKTQKAAREALIREGIFTSEGKLSPRYGGPRKARVA